MARRNRRNRRVNRRNNNHNKRKRHHRNRRSRTGVIAIGDIKNYARAKQITFLLTIIVLVPALVLNFVYGLPMFILAPLYATAGMFFIMTFIFHSIHIMNKNTNQVSAADAEADIERSVSTISIANSQTAQVSRQLLASAYVTTSNEHQQLQQDLATPGHLHNLQDPMSVAPNNPGPPAYFTPNNVVSAQTSVGQLQKTSSWPTQSIATTFNPPASSTTGEHQPVSFELPPPSYNDVSANNSAYNANGWIR